MVTLIVLSITSFFVAYWFLSYLGSETVTGEFDHLFTYSTTYFVLLFFSFTFVLIDSGLMMANAEIIAYMLK